MTQPTLLKTNIAEPTADVPTGASPLDNSRVAQVPRPEMPSGYRIMNVTDKPVSIDSIDPPKERPRPPVREPLPSQLPSQAMNPRREMQPLRVAPRANPLLSGVGKKTDEAKPQDPNDDGVIGGGAKTKEFLLGAGAQGWGYVKSAIAHPFYTAGAIGAVVAASALAPVAVPVALGVAAGGAVTFGGLSAYSRINNAKTDDEARAGWSDAGATFTDAALSALVLTKGLQAVKGALGMTAAGGAAPAAAAAATTAAPAAAAPASTGLTLSAVTNAIAHPIQTYQGLRAAGSIAAAGSAAAEQAAINAAGPQGLFAAEGIGNAARAFGIGTPVNPSNIAALDAAQALGNASIAVGQEAGAIAQALASGPQGLYAAESIGNVARGFGVGTPTNHISAAALQSAESIGKASVAVGNTIADQAAAAAAGPQGLFAAESIGNAVRGIGVGTPTTPTNISALNAAQSLGNASRTIGQSLEETAAAAARAAESGLEGLKAAESIGNVSRAFGIGTPTNTTSATGFSAAESIGNASMSIGQAIQDQAAAAAAGPQGLFAAESIGNAARTFGIRTPATTTDILGLEAAQSIGNASIASGQAVVETRAAVQGIGEAARSIGQSLELPAPDFQGLYAAESIGNMARAFGVGTPSNTVSTSGLSAAQSIGNASIALGQTVQNSSAAAAAGPQGLFAAESIGNAARSFGVRTPVEATNIIGLEAAQSIGSASIAAGEALVEARAAAQSIGSAAMSVGQSIEFQELYAAESIGNVARSFGVGTPTNTISVAGLTAAESIGNASIAAGQALQDQAAIAAAGPQGLFAAESVGNAARSFGIRTPADPTDILALEASRALGNASMAAGEAVPEARAAAQSVGDAARSVGKFLEEEASAWSQRPPITPSTDPKTVFSGRPRTGRSQFFSRRFSFPREPGHE